MKRPLLWIAVVLVFGILIAYDSYDRETDSLFKGLFLPPDLRLRLEAAEDQDEDAFSGVLTGEAVWLFEREEQTLIEVNTKDAAIGKVRVYLSMPFQECSILPGDTVSFSGHFFLFASADNPGEFDMRAYMDHLHVYLGFSAESYKIEHTSSSLKKPVFRLLKKMVQTIDERAPEPYKASFKAVLCGNQSLLSDETQDLYSTAGVLYLLSASGFLFSAIGSALFNFFRKRFGSAAASVLSMFITACLAVFSGGSVSMIRAFLIFMIRILAERFGRVFDLLSGASLALILLLLSNPEIIFLSAVQYYLSVLFATGIVAPAVHAYLFRYRKGFTEMINLIVIQACLLPITIMTSYRASIFSILLAALFLSVRALMWLVTAVSSLTGLPFLFEGEAGIFAAEEWLFRNLLKIPGAAVIEGRPDDVRLIVYFLLLLLAALFYRILFLRQKKKKEEEEHRITAKDSLLAVLIFLSVYVFGILFLHAPKIPEGETAADVLYVGQGDGILIRMRDRNYLIDCGSTSKQNVGKDTLLPALLYYGVRKLDGVFLTHNDQDHINGVQYLLEDRSVPIDRFYVSEQAVLSGDFSWIPEEKRVLLSKGDTVGSFTVLWPEGEIDDRNEGSLVLSALFDGGSALFTGDISAEAEERIRIEKQYDLLKVAHHGSKYSSSDAFLQKIRPQIAVVSYGRKNVYGHPTEEACERILSTGAVLYKTGECGCISIRFRKDRGIAVTPFHDASGRR